MGEPHWLFDEEAWEEHHSIRKPKLNYDPDDPEPVDDWRYYEYL
tara:strand:- start:306 stop:437 length:132 start_codon:yes stop_codon:yes gene_type:complete